MMSCTEEPFEAIRVALGQFSSVVSRQQAELNAVIQGVVTKMEAEWDRFDTIQNALDRKRQRLLRVQDAMATILNDSESTMPVWIRQELQAVEEDDNFSLQQPKQHRRSTRSKWLGVKAPLNGRSRERVKVPLDSWQATRSPSSFQGVEEPFNKYRTTSNKNMNGSEQAAIASASWATLRESLTKNTSTSRESSSSMGTSSPHADIEGSTAKIAPSGWSATVQQQRGSRSRVQENANGSGTQATADSANGLESSDRKLKSKQYSISTSDGNTLGGVDCVRASRFRSEDVPDSWAPMRGRCATYGSELPDESSSGKESTDVDASPIDNL